MAQLAKFCTLILETPKVPSPLEKASGTVCQPFPPTRAISVLPFPLKSPEIILRPGADAQVAKLVIGWFVTLNVPSPLEKATGCVPHPCPPTSAISVFPFPPAIEPGHSGESLLKILAY